MTDIELITRNIKNSVEAAEIPEVCLKGCEDVYTRVDTTNAAICMVEDTVGALVAALETCAIRLPVEPDPEPVTETQINEILKVTERMAKINEALRVLGESKIYLNSLKAVVFCKTLKC